MMDEQFTSYDTAAIWDITQHGVIHYKRGRIFPMEDQAYIAEKLCELLNNNASHNGRWSVIWAAPKDRWVKEDTMFRVAVPQYMIFEWYARAEQDLANPDLPAFRLDFARMKYPDWLYQITDLKEFVERADMAWERMRGLALESRHYDSQTVQETRESGFPGAAALPALH